MKQVGIIAEYNPLHLGHEKQIRKIYDICGQDTAIVCLMSGSFVQRGEPAIFDKSLRAQAAVACGASLVLEMPVTVSLSSAEGFASGSVNILSQCCDSLCFGTETGNSDSLIKTAKALLTPAFTRELKLQLESGCSFPSSRQRALQALGCDATLLSLPNNILGVEYCKAILQQNASLTPLPIRREGDYHAADADAENPSATALRQLLTRNGDWEHYVPEAAVKLFRDAPVHTLAAGERAMLGKLRTMTDGEFEALPYGSEGLWRKFMAACRKENTLEEILTATKSKRYTRTRLNRMAMCAFLGIPEAMLTFPAPYVRVLAFDDKGREILRARKDGFFRNTGEVTDHPYWALEQRCGSLYGLFCTDGTEPPLAEKNRRISYKQNGDARTK